MFAFLKKRLCRRGSLKQQHRRLRIERLELRHLLNATGIIVSDADDLVIRGDDFVSFRYSGGPMGMFSSASAGALPMKAFQSPGMPPMNGRNGVWEFVGMGDFNGDGKQDMVAKDAGIASVVPSKNGQWWVGINTGTSNDNFNFSLWDGAIPSFGTVDGATQQLTWGDHQVADFTGDGKSDVLARVRETGKWYLWTTNASGTAFTVESTGLTPKSSLFGTWKNTVVVDALTDHHFQWRDALVGDFNGDGRADLAGRRITNDTGSSAWDEWYVGLGTATTTNRGETGVPVNNWWHITDWQHDSTLAVNDTTWGNAVLGDFNGDGRSDIAGRMAYPTLANGDREGEWWVSYTPATVGTNVAAVAWADWDHAVGGNQLHWRDVQSGDFNNDGYDDILGRTRFGVWHMVNGATGTTSVVGTWGTSYTDYPIVVAGDFTGDGKIDLAARKNGDMQWYLSTFTSGSVNFPTPVARGGHRMLVTKLREDYFVKGSPQGHLGTSLPLALLEDLGRFNPPPDSEKDPQFIIGRYNADGSLDWEGYGGGVPFANNYGSRYHLDFNGDNLPDVLMQLNNGQWYYSENYGNSFVTSVSNISWPLSEQRWLQIGDFTGDGKEDLLSQKPTGPLTAEWYLHAARGDGTFTNDLIHTRTYTSQGEHVWLVNGYVGDFDGDGRDDVSLLHKLNDNPSDRTFVVEVVFSNGVPPTPASPTPAQPAWSPVNYWQKVETATEYAFKHWGVGDFNGDGIADVWGMQMTSIIVGPPVLSEQHEQVWVALGGGLSGTWNAVYTLPETINEVTVDKRGSTAGRFDSTVDNKDDIVLEIVPYPGPGPSQTRTISSATWTVDSNVTGTSGRTGGEQYVLVGDLDHDGSDDLIWIGTTPTHPIDLFVRKRIEHIPWVPSGEVISGNGVPSYIWTLNNRLRRRKP